MWWHSFLKPVFGKCCFSDSKDLFLHGCKAGTTIMQNKNPPVWPFFSSHHSSPHTKSFCLFLLSRFYSESITKWSFWPQVCCNFTLTSWQNGIQHASAYSKVFSFVASVGFSAAETWWVKYILPQVIVNMAIFHVHRTWHWKCFWSQ